MAGLVEFLKPLNDLIKKATALTEGRRSDFFHHLKTGADSLTALAWIAYAGKDCGKKKLSTVVPLILELVNFFAWTINVLSNYRYEFAYCTCGRKLANG